MSPPPPPATGQRYQAREQAAAQRRLLDQAERLRGDRWHRGPTQTVPTAPAGSNRPARHRFPISRDHWPAGEER
ncbi:hypothetical protein [Micromonospora sp. NPDC050495]|uniref:hypothetical protein n=1 Tax=Micromonospora sp. NPDC050495 TaxID=3154936 RepID=UPI0033C22F97